MSEMESNLVCEETEDQPGQVSSVASIQEMVATLKWDGVDRLSALVDECRCDVSQDAQTQRLRAQKWLDELPKLVHCFRTL